MPGRLDQPALRRGVRHAGGDIDGPKGVVAQGDGDAVACRRSELALAVEGDEPAGTVSAHWRVETDCLEPLDADGSTSPGAIGAH